MSKEKQKPPFEVGDKVICIETDPAAMRNGMYNEYLKSGNEYVVKECEKDGWQDSEFGVVVEGMKTEWDSSSFRKTNNIK